MSVRFPASGTLSVLFDRLEDRRAADDARPPGCFPDLHLNQIVASLCAERDAYRLEPFFHWPLRRRDAIDYRHQVFRDLEHPALLGAIRNFAAAMRDVRGHAALVAKLSDRYHKQGWLLQTAQLYCHAVETLARDLVSLPVRSKALSAMSSYLDRYAASEAFAALFEETGLLLRQLVRVSYSILIHDDAFTVGSYGNEADYSAEIEATFAKFRQGATKNHLVEFKSAPQDLNHIEAKILQFVGQLNPELFARLQDYARRHASFINETIAMFERDIQFYLACLEQAARHAQAGLRFCLPTLSDTPREVSVTEGFDLALANKRKGTSAVVCNDLSLTGGERIIVVSGPNQGGKTTFARMFGQLHYLGSLGCPVPARAARLAMFDTIFTHFEKEEKVENLRGKLEDDLVRIHAILKDATARSVIILNEVFTSTTIQDEVFLSRKVLDTLFERGMIGVWVTFVDELAAHGPQTVSMVSTIVPDNPAERTFKIVRQPADGLAYAMAIAAKYRLTHDHILGRIAS
jgi:DNA mismatch repair protein MutS